MRHILSWVLNGIKTRCYNKNCRSYQDYWARWITVCDEWKNSSKAFYDDMMDWYKKWLQIDRIDNNGNYCKENCRWVTAKENCRNRRNTLYNSLWVILIESAEKSNISYDHLRYLNNKISMLSQNKKWRSENKESIKEKSKKYYQNNKESIAEKSKMRRQNNVNNYAK